MFREAKRERLILELMLVALSIGLTCLVYKTEGYKITTLNLFYLPVVLSGFFLGRYTTGILAVFCVIVTSLVCVMQLDEFSSYTSPLAVGLTITIWGAVLCLTALLVGTLSDERNKQAEELHEAYVGVVEVLAKYLQGGNSHLNEATNRVVRLSQLIALEMRLSSKCIDNIRVAALMQGFSTIEITTKVISKAVHSLEAKGNSGAFSFHGTDLVHSLGAVLHGAIPILVNQDHVLLTELQQRTPTEVPIGAQILRVAQAFDTLTMSRSGENLTPPAALQELRANLVAAYDLDVLDVLERVVAEKQELLQV